MPNDKLLFPILSLPYSTVCEKERKMGMFLKRIKCWPSDNSDFCRICLPVNNLSFLLHWSLDGSERGLVRHKPFIQLDLF